MVLGLVLISTGCESLRPPAHDRQAWESQQKQEEVRQECAREKDPLGMSLYLAYVGYCLGEIGYILSQK